MTDSSSFTSLMALVDSHLSKTSLQSQSEDGEGRGSFPLPILNGVEKGLSDTRLPSPCQRFPLPSLGLNKSPINDVLALQVSNMLKAKELKKQQDEEQRLANEMKKIKIEQEEDNCEIDLMQALQTPFTPQPLQPKETLSNSSSFESLLLEYTKDFYKDIESSTNSIENIPQEPILPCKSDMSYILHQKIRKGKCSPFGKVLTSRLRPVASTYLRKYVVSKVVRFDFSTKSPCDLIQERLKNRNAYTPNVTYIEQILSETLRDSN